MADKWWILLFLVAALTCTLDANLHSEREENLNKETRQAQDFTEEELQDIAEYLQEVKPEDLKYMTDEEKFELSVLLSIVGPDIQDVL